MRVSGTVVAGAGLLAAAWVLTVWQWQDPFTALYTAHQQHRLEGDFKEEQARYVPPPHRHRASLAAERRLVASEAHRYRKQLHVGEAVGRLQVPRLGLNAIVVNGTDHDSLTKGPGRYTGSYVPGEGQLIYIAGHRTTYSAPFAHIERLKRGDLVTIDVPYGRFVYRVRNSVIVPAGDVARLRSHGHEVVALQACHPRFFATERYIVYAQPLEVQPRGGRPYRLRSRPA